MLSRLRLWSLWTPGAHLTSGVFPAPALLDCMAPERHGMVIQPIPHYSTLFQYFGRSSNGLIEILGEHEPT